MSGWRIAGLGVFFAALFGVLGMRLWYVQVAEGAVNAELAESNQTLQVQTFAPRGIVYDRNLEVLAASELVPAIVLDTRLMPDGVTRTLLQRLSGLLDVPVSELRAIVDEAPGPRFTLADRIRPETAFYIWEHQREFPGVVIEQVPLRVYPNGDVMAHVLGHVGIPTAEDVVDDPSLRAVDVIGKLGVERAYDELLRGELGRTVFRVNKDQEILAVLAEDPPEQGHSLVLTLDLELQSFVEDTLADGIAFARRVEDTDASHGAIVVIDPRDGAIRAMASFPDFDPNLFVEGIPQSVYQELLDARAFNNLAIQGLYPPGSTFKAVTYVTALEERIFPEGADGPEDRIECSATLQAPFNEGQRRFRNWTYPDDDGFQNLHEAFARSCNIYFWEVALQIWERYKGTPKENLIQSWARKLGLGNETGIDLPFEAAGRIPDRELFEEWKQQQLRDPSLRLLHPERMELPGGPWLGGDLLNVAVGQGDVLVTPLQMAAAYATIVNGGTVWRPHVLASVLDGDGRVVQQVGGVSVRTVGLSPSTVTAFRRDARATVTSGTARGAFIPMGNLAEQVGGKTGTAQRANAANTAWFVGFAPVDEPRYVVAVVIEEGGSGGKVAAPIARRIFQRLLGQQTTPLAPGLEAD